MATGTPRKSQRREPKQKRARQTVDAVLDGVMRVLKKEGIEGVTTNRVAAAAGVSIGSVYQYFPDKRAIFGALHDRHAEQIGRVVERTLVDYAAAPVEALVGALMERLIDAHAVDPELHELLASVVPHGARGALALDARLHAALRLAVAAHRRAKPGPRDVERVLFILSNMIESLSHAATLRRPASVSLAAARREAVLAVTSYVRSWRGPPSSR